MDQRLNLVKSQEQHKEVAGKPQKVTMILKSLIKRKRTLKFERCYILTVISTQRPQHTKIKQNIRKVSLKSHESIFELNKHALCVEDINKNFNVLTNFVYCMCRQVFG